ncbi:MAG TPA: hypothetical protein VE988_30755 [Gemmataceae bacterium]|nr:hypothetical protein [Gemmataceae bacterium]
MKRLLISSLLVLVLAFHCQAAPTLGGPIAPDGKTKVMIDFPLSLRKENVGGRDGAGLCVFTSIMHSARWQKETPLEDFQTLMRKELGGGWPEKVDKMIGKYAGGVDYFQYEGRDLLVLQMALQSGRLPSVTYSGRDPHYKGSVSHMVNLVHLDEQWACILDNNFIGADQLVWMTPKEFVDRWGGKGSGWTVILLKEPPDIPVTGGNVTHQIIKDHKPLFGVQRNSDKGGDGEKPWLVKYIWYYWDGDPDRIYLNCETLDHETQVGAFDIKHNYFCYYHAEYKEWLSTKCEPPFPPPSVTPGQASGIVGYAEDEGPPLCWCPPRVGVDERWTRKGVPAKREDLLKLLQPKPAPGPLPIGPNGGGTGPALVTSLLLLAAFVIHLLPKESV